MSKANQYVDPLRHSPFTNITSFDIWPVAVSGRSIVEIRTRENTDSTLPDVQLQMSTPVAKELRRLYLRDRAIAIYKAAGADGAAEAAGIVTHEKLLDEYEDLYDSGQFCTMATRFCSAYKAIRVTTELSPAMSLFAKRRGHVGIGICSHTEYFPLCDCPFIALDQTDGVVRMINSAPFTDWPPSARKAAQRVGSHILKQIKAGICGC